MSWPSAWRASMRARLVRRERPRRHGRRLDLRRTIHRSISHGGTPIDLVWRRRKPKPLRLVVLLDASGSMSLYTAFFVRFIHGVVDAFREAEAFVFHTRLVHVSDSLRERDVSRAIDRLSLMAEGIGGGTRIGESLATFNRWHAARVINSRTAVMILSDGYDTGEPERLAHRDGAAPAALPADRLAQSADRLGELCARGARHAGGAALYRSVRPGPQPREPRGARALSREDLMARGQATDILDLISAMKAKGEPFALATVVRTVAATAAKAGAKAVIRADGSVTEGWIGGGCAPGRGGEGRARGAGRRPAAAGLGSAGGRVCRRRACSRARSAPASASPSNMCPSQGTMDVFVEPVLPRPQLVVCGSSPVAVAIADLGRRIGFALTVCAPAAEQGAFAEADRRIEGYALPPGHR